MLKEQYSTTVANFIAHKPVNKLTLVLRPLWNKNNTECHYTVLQANKEEKLVTYFNPWDFSPEMLILPRAAQDILDRLPAKKSASMRFIFGTQGSKDEDCGNRCLDYLTNILQDGEKLAFSDKVLLPLGPFLKHEVKTASHHI